MLVKMIKDKLEVIVIVDVLEINGENRYNCRFFFFCVECLIKFEFFVGFLNGGSFFDVIVKFFFLLCLLYLILIRLFGGRRMDFL